MFLRVLRFLGPGGLLLEGEFQANVGEQTVFLGGQSHPRVLTGTPAGGPLMLPNEAHSLLSPHLGSLVNLQVLFMSIG